MIAQHLPAGTTLAEGSIVIDKLIGQGGFSFVYKGSMYLSARTDNAFVTGKGYKIPVIIKELFIADRAGRQPDGKTIYWNDENNPNEETRLSSRIKEKTVSEAKKLQKLQDCPYVVKIINAFRENNTIYQVTEEISNAVDFKEKLQLSEDQQGVVLPLKQTLKYIRQISEALREVHHNDIVHLDIKPENILCDSYDNAILIDFGISVTISSTGTKSKTTFLGAASIPWAPNEQLYNNYAAIGFATDIYSLGQTFYAFLTGRIPIYISSNSYLPPSAYNSEVSPYLDKVIAKCIQAEAIDRYQTIDEFLVAFEGEKDYTKLITEAQKAATLQQYEKALRLLRQSEKYIPLTPELTELRKQCEADPEKERKEALAAIHNIYLVPLTELTEAQIASEQTKVAQKINLIEAYNQKYPTHTEYYLLQQCRDHQKELETLKLRFQQQEADLDAIKRIVLIPINKLRKEEIESAKIVVEKKLSLIKKYQRNYPTDYNIKTILNECKEYQKKLEGTIVFDDAPIKEESVPIAEPFSTSSSSKKSSYTKYIIAAVGVIAIGIFFFMRNGNATEAAPTQVVAQRIDTPEGYCLYTGHLDNGQPQDSIGEAKYYTKGGELLYTYKGGFANGKRTGVGSVVEKRMESNAKEFDYFIYTGKVINDEANDLNGKGVYYSSQLKYPFVYEGGYKGNKRSGKGCETYAEADKQEKKNKGINPAESFCGNFKDDFPNGKLTIKFADGTSMTADYNGNYNPTNKKHYDKNGQVVNNQ